MECQVRSMASSSIAEDVNIPEGKVESVCREWIVREDGVLAYKLQTEEIQHHYGHNKEKNQLVRSDFKEACTAQKDEDEEAAMIQQAYEKMLKEQEEKDAFIAQQLQEKLLQEELEHQKRVEEEDQRIALELQRKEKLRLQRKREERELRQAEKARAEISSTSNSSSIKSFDDLICTKEASTSPLEKDFNELCIRAPENLTGEELQKFIEQRDAELARLIQENELKCDGNLDRQIAIEAQDRELARVLQEQERAKARKARERARQKALLNQQQENMNSIEEAPIGIAANSDKNNENTCVKTRLKNDWGSADRRNFASDFSGDPVNNIAAAIDPTFNNTTSPSVSPSSTIYSTNSNTPLSSPTIETPSHNVRNTNEGFYGLQDDAIVPPYMPIQGTRRPTTLEKGKKNKKNKEGCKTQ